LGEAYRYGEVIGVELRDYGMNVNLGGNINLIGREPRDGRSFETKGEDPLLAGEIAANHLRAIQDQYVVAGLKHFGFNDQETGRYTANAVIDERSARESDLLAFEIAMKESNVQSVMCAYNLVNGTYSCGNAHLLTDILKGDWGFFGFVMSDWGATPSSYPSAIAGLDQEQPGDMWFATLDQAVKNGSLPLSRLDNMVHRILRAMFASGLFDHPTRLQTVDVRDDEAVAQEAEEQGSVLLKNGGLLPLNASGIRSVALIGSHADVGVLSGGGSAEVIPHGGPALIEGHPCPPCVSTVIWDPSSPMKAIQAKLPNGSVQFRDGVDLNAATALASASDVAVVFISQWESEDMYVPSLNFTDLIHSIPIDQDALVKAVAAANSRTVVVMENGGAQVMPWLNNVGAVLEAWYPGERGGEAIANILFGDVNPSGKLPITFPASVSDLPRPVIPTPYENLPFDVNYNIEGFNVGYKWYDANGIQPLFPFGYGLSYTTFSFSNLSLSTTSFRGVRGFQVSFYLTNTGSMPGSEVAQVYLGLPKSTGEPPKRLVGWGKIFLRPGQTQAVTVQVSEDDPSHPLSYWDVSSSGWQTAPGDYSVYLGNASRGFNSATCTRIGGFQI
jgi:beta-glucosidase